MKDEECHHVIAEQRAEIDRLREELDKRDTLRPVASELVSELISEVQGMRLDLRGYAEEAMKLATRLDQHQKSYHCPHPTCPYEESRAPQ